MTTTYKFADPAPYAHQILALRRIIETKGRCALLMEPGCITGDSRIGVNRAGRGFEVSLKELHDKFNGGWDPSIPTRIRRAMPDGTVRLGEVFAVLDSGVKEVWTLRLTDGRELTGTADHPVMIEGGEFVGLGELKPGDRVVAEAGRSTSGSGRDRGERKYYRDRYTKFHPHQRRANRPGRWRHPEHRLVVEATLNQLSLEEFLRVLNTDEARAGTLSYLTPGVVVHHRDGDHRNNSPGNLSVEESGQSGHASKHGLGNAKNVLIQTAPVEVLEVIYAGEQHTYDVSMVDEPHNFLANGIAVHNTGKTRSTLDYASALAVKLDAEVKVLVVAPLAAVDTWVEQAGAWCGPQVDVYAEALGGSVSQRCEALRDHGDTLAPTKGQLRRSLSVLARSGGKLVPPTTPLGTPRVRVVVINIDSFSSRHPVTPGGTITVADRLVGAVRAYAPDLLVLDESHMIKGRSSNRTRTMMRIRDVAPRRLILTGTVMPHSPLDVYSQWRWLNPDRFASVRRGELKTWSFAEFQSRYARLGGWQGKEVVGFQNLDEMQDRMAPDVVVVSKDDALDLPPTTEVILPVHLSPKEERAYKEMRENLATQLDDGSLMSAPNPLTKMLRLQQITSGFAVDDATREIVEVGSSKVKTIASLVNDTLAGEKRVVVFAKFRRDIAKLVEALNDTVEITGDTPPEQRTKIRKMFGPDGDLSTRMVLVCQVSTMSLAVNELVTASHAVFSSLSYQRDVFVQAQDRLNRIGQTRPVTYYYALARGTIDEVILKAIKSRSSVEKAVLEHVKAGL